MKKFVTFAVAAALVLSVGMFAGCEEKSKDAGKNIKRTLDNAQRNVDKVNKRMKESLPKE